MRLPFRFLACAGLAVMASACATFGTNVEGSFQCRAPKGECAPSHVLDLRPRWASGTSQLVAKLLSRHIDDLANRDIAMSLTR